MATPPRPPRAGTEGGSILPLALTLVISGRLDSGDRPLSDNSCPNALFEPIAKVELEAVGTSRLSLLRWTGTGSGRRTMLMLLFGNGEPDRGLVNGKAEGVGDASAHDNDMDELND